MTYGTANIDAMATSTGQILGAGNSTAFKNRIINGAMTVNQYGGSPINAGLSSYVIDRWQIYNNTSGAWTGQQSSTAPTGFSNSLLFTVTTPFSMSASYASGIWQKIEGYNIADLAWGTAYAKTITMSFWVYSSISGTFSGALLNSSGGNSYPFTYTISATNTWQQITLTIPGATSGTWLTNNGIGIWICFSTGCGSNRQGTPNTWGTSLSFAATGETQLVATSGATFYITGIQFEVGSTATSFDYRDYGRELILCQRYYELISGIAGGYIIFVGQAISGSDVQSGGIFKTSKRAAPSVSAYGTINANGYNNGGAGSVTITSSSAGTETWGIRWTGASGLTAGNASGIYPSNASSGIAFSAEL